MSFYEKYGVLLSPSKDWEYGNYGFDVQGIGDCISRTMNHARENSDIKLIGNCTALLKHHKRWPDEFNNDRIAKNKPREWWSKLLQKLYIQKYCLYRPQGNMSRDPYNHYYAACYSMNLMWLIKYIKPPWWLYRPSLWSWRRYLITGRHKKRYETIAIISLWIGMPEYARNQERIKAEVAGSERVLNYLNKP